MAAPATRTPARPFVGRVPEIGELRAALEEAASGRGSLVLVTGEPGIGKTRLMGELAQSALEDGFGVLVGRCSEEGGAPAYWPWIQVVRAAGGELEQLAGATPAATAVDPESRRFGLFDAVTQFVAAAARERPLLIVLDDLHAADVPSLLLLRFLAEGLGERRALVVASYRAGERRVGELAAVFAELVRLGRRLPLSGLDVDEVEDYLAGLDGPSSHDRASRLHAMTQGNPFFLGEVVRLPAGGRVPREVRALIRRRVAGLSPAATDALRIAAVGGRALDLGTLERTSALGAGPLLDVLAEALDAGVLTGRYAFAHELVRETLYADLPPSRRAELHLAIGRELERRHRADLDPYLSEIAHHLARAAPLGEVAAAVDYLLRAGDRARDVLAYEEAIAHYRRALELAAGETPPERRCELLLRLGDAEWRAGDVTAARASFEAATGLARRVGAATMLARAALGYVNALGGFLLFARFEAGATAVGLLEEALAALPDSDSPLRAELLAHLALELHSSNELVERRVAVSEQAIEVARRLGDPEALVAALHSRNWVLAMPELVRERLAHTGEMLRAAEETDNRQMRFLAHNARFHCFLELCDRRAMEVEIETMARIGELVRQPFFVWHALCLRTVCAILDGRFGEAERLANQALELGRLRHGVYPAYVFRYAQLFAIRWAQGRASELGELIADHGDRFPWVARWREALAAVEATDEAAARAEVERHAARDFADLPRDGLWILHLCSLAEACALIGDRPRGARLYELLLPHADRNAVSYTQLPFGPVALRLGMLAALLGRPADAEHHFERALERCDAVGARAIRARVHYEHASVLLTVGEAERATAMLAAASALCDELGLTGIAERVAAISSPPGSAFQREGEFWTIAHNGRTSRLKDAKGLRYIALLLAGPCRDVHVLELARAAEGLDHDAADLRASGADAVVLDGPAKAAYRRRLDDLAEDLEEARDWRDGERAARVEEEIDALTDELARAAGLGGRDRRLPSPAERARVSVTKAIRTAIRTIGKHDPALAAHLTAAIRTGRLCSYAPPGETPPRWAL
jgi:tetratricopeptide (TPR) repeat protein